MEGGIKDKRKRHKQEAQNKDQENSRAVSAIIFGEVQPAISAFISQVHCKARLIEVAGFTFWALARPAGSHSFII